MNRIRILLACALTCFAAIQSSAQSVIVGWGNSAYDATNPPPSLTNVIAISAGYQFSLALKSDGTVVGWGYNNYGQTNVPTGLSNVVAVAAGNYHALALKSNGTVIAWGSGYVQTNVPAGLSNVVAIACGGSHSLALKDNGTVIAWGENLNNQTRVPSGLTNVVAIAGGAFHSLAVKNNGTAVAWGSTYSGETTVPFSLSNAVAVAGGDLFSLALTSDGKVIAWGDNNYGQTSVPSALSNVVAIAAGGYNSLALQGNGTVVAWGYNGYGQTNVPPGLTNVGAIASGFYHSLALRDGPRITAQPQSATVNGGSSAAFSVTAVGSPPLSYQWHLNSAALAGRTTSVLNLTNLQCVNMGNYTVVVTNNFGAVTSAVVVLNVKATNPPAILSFVASPTSPLLGEAITYTVILNEGGPHDIEYEIGDTETEVVQVNGYCGTNFSYTLTADAFPLTAGGFYMYVYVTNAAGHAFGGVGAVTPPAFSLSRGTPSVFSGSGGLGCAQPPATICGANAFAAGTNSSWFRLVTTESGTITASSVHKGTNSPLAIFGGSIISCSTLSNLACSASGRLQIPVTASNQYFVLAGGINVTDSVSLTYGYEPRLESCKLATNGFELHSSAAPPLGYRLQVATNLPAYSSNWTTLLSTNFTSYAPYLFFVDTNASKFKQRFYRLAPGA